MATLQLKASGNSAAEGERDAVKYYENGKLASRFSTNGTGFIYYPNGSVAFCSSEASEYQNRYFVFDKDRRNTLLLSIDEHCVGFISGSKRKSLRGSTSECAFTKVGGIITNSQGQITHQWKWDPKAQNAGNPPQETPIIFHLNEHFHCSFTSRFDISLEFEYDAIKFQIDMGMKFKRYDSYLDQAKKTLDGKLIPQIPHVSLKQRQVQFNQQMSMKRNKVHPKSENLSPMVRDIVGKLETNFDDIGETLKLSPESSSWKLEALNKTISEIPKIELTGVETGILAGLGNEIYVAKEENSPLARTAPARLVNGNGEWKDSLAIRTTIREENPPLPRKSAILKASGRYSNMLVVDPNAVSSHNPTGMIEIGGLPLPHVRWETLKNSLQNEDGNKFTVVLALRPGDPICCSYLRIAEIVNRHFHESQSQETPPITRPNNGSRPNSAITRKLPPRLVQVDISENSSLVHEFGIKTLPIFLIFHGANLVYAGSIGGKKIKLDTMSHKPQVLLIESNFKDQIVCEKTLRKVGCEPFLSLSISEAIHRIQQLTNPTPDPVTGRVADPVIFDLILISEEVETESILQLKKLLLDMNPNNRTIVAMLVSVLGEYGRANLNAVRWEGGCSSEVSAFSNRHLNEICSIALQKPIKQISIEKVLSMRTLPQNESNFGITPETLEGKIRQVQNDILNGKSRPRIDYIGIRLSAQDTKMRNGRDLTT